MSVMRKLTVLLVPAFVAVFGVDQAAAGAFNFTNLNGGVQGSLGTGSVTTGGVTATGYQYIPAIDTLITGNLNLWLRNESGDRGLGLCTNAESISGAGCVGQGGDYNELSN